MMKIYVCSPYRGDVEANVALARKIGREIALGGDIPIIPHLLFPQLLNDDDDTERELGLKMALELLRDCDLVLVVGDTITEGMRAEIKEASKRGRDMLGFCAHWHDVVAQIRHEGE